MTDYDLRQRVAQEMAYADRASFDASTSANDHWQHTSATTQDVWLNLASTALSVIAEERVARAEAQSADAITALTAERDDLLKACNKWAEVSQANFQWGKAAGAKLAIARDEIARMKEANAALRAANDMLLRAALNTGTDQ